MVPLLIIISHYIPLKTQMISQYDGKVIIHSIDPLYPIKVTLCYHFHGSKAPTRNGSSQQLPEPRTRRFPSGKATKIQHEKLSQGGVS